MKKYVANEDINIIRVIRLNIVLLFCMSYNTIIYWLVFSAVKYRKNYQKINHVSPDFNCFLLHIIISVKTSGQCYLSKGGRL